MGREILFDREKERMYCRRLAEIATTKVLSYRSESEAWLRLSSELVNLTARVLAAEALSKAPRCGAPVALRDTNRFVADALSNRRTERVVLQSTAFELCRLSA